MADDDCMLYFLNYSCLRSFCMLGCVDISFHVAVKQKIVPIKVQMAWFGSVK